jgi:hypothetical protein
MFVAVLMFVVDNASLSKVSEKLDKDNAHILQQQVCYLNDGSGDFFVDCLTTERENAFVDKVIKDLEAIDNNKPKDSLPQTQKTDKISPSLDKRYLEEYHQPSSAKLTQMQWSNNQQKSHPIHRLNNTLAVAKCVHCLCLTFHLLC